VKKLASIGGAGLTVIALLAARGRAADHSDSPTLGGNPMADITDVYAWMTSANLNLVMDVSPRDDGTRGFDPSVLYVFHLTSKPGRGVGAAGGTETKVIVRFASSSSVQCWVTDAAGAVIKDYVTGDPSRAGVASILGKIKVFAGRRADPFFFNQAGFDSAVTALRASTLNPDPAGCPMGIDEAQAQALRSMLETGADAYAGANVMAIVVQLDKALVNDGANTTVAVWGSTHAAP
jgi:hypothetical protein